jgi:hypothetical protein
MQLTRQFLVTRFRRGEGATVEDAHQTICRQCMEHRLVTLVKAGEGQAQRESSAYCGEETCPSGAK